MKNRLPATIRWPNLRGLGKGVFYCARAGARRVLLRIGMALGRDGGALPALDRLTTWFLGGSFGDGRQYMSWISLADLTRAFIAAIEREDFSGTYNAVAPNPLTNNDFMGELRRVLQRPWCPPHAGMGHPYWRAAAQDQAVAGAHQLPLRAETPAGRRLYL